MSRYDIPGEETPGLAKAAIGAVRLVSNNPGKATEKDVIKLLDGND